MQTTHSEAALEAYLHRKVRSLGGIALKLAPTVKGMPDRLILMPGGRLYMVELKAVGGRLSAVQVLWQERARAIGHRIHVVVGKEGIDRWIRDRVNESCPHPIDSPAKDPESAKRRTA